MFECLSSRVNIADLKGRNLFDEGDRQESEAGGGIDYVEDHAN